MTYRIRIIDGHWRLLRHGAIIGSFEWRIDAVQALKDERKRRGE